MYKAIYLNVILIIIPSNETHLTHLLYISVFKPFKTVLKRRMEENMIEKYFN